MGSATFLAPVGWPTPAVEPCCWVGAVFGAPLGFLPCVGLFLRDLRFAQLPLGGFSAFSVTGCLTYFYSGAIGWACRGLLGSAPCVRELPLGLCLLFGRQCYALLAFPYLRVGALLAWGVYGVS